MILIHISMMDPGVFEGLVRIRLSSRVWSGSGCPRGFGPDPVVLGAGYGRSPSKPLKCFKNKIIHKIGQLTPECTRHLQKTSSFSTL